jgi:hypothetical protein
LTLPKGESLSKWIPITRTTPNYSEKMSSHPFTLLGIHSMPNSDTGNPKGATTSMTKAQR